MNTKNFLVGGIVGGVVYFILGYLLYGNLLADFFQKNTTYYNTDMATFKMWALILGNLFSGFLLAYIFTKAGVFTVTSGLITAGVIGFFMSGSYDLIMYGTSKMMNKEALMVDVATFTIVSAIAGAVIAGVIRMLSKTRTTVTGTIV
jgi:hypothetical protein